MKLAVGISALARIDMKRRVLVGPFPCLCEIVCRRERSPWKTGETTRTAVRIISLSH